jgi:hypothetical protein
MLGRQHRRRLPEVLGELADTANVLVNGLGRIVANAEVLDYPLAQMCHCELLSKTLRVLERGSFSTCHAVDREKIVVAADRLYREAVSFNIWSSIRSGRREIIAASGIVLV